MDLWESLRRLVASNDVTTIILASKDSATFESEWLREHDQTAPRTFSGRPVVYGSDALWCSYALGTDEGHPSFWTI